ncbi:MAG: acyl--CoA ligase [Desulfurococcales archaeon]|nr:acyl--CoA ligase [Desulfurococcales archaeon]
MSTIDGRPWHKVWPQGVPKVLDTEYTPIYTKAWSGPAGKMALIQAETGYCYTYEKLKTVSKSIAAWLQSRGAWKGEQVALAARNTVQAAAALIGALASGARTVLIDPLTIGEDLRIQLEGRRFVALIADREFLERNRPILEETGPREVLSLDWVDGLEDLHVSGLGDTPPPGEWRDPEPGPGDDSIALYYSGIAGRTMQAIHTHAGLHHAVKAYNLMAGVDSGYSSLAVASITHVLGLQLSLLSPLAEGGTVYMMRRWRPSLAARLVEEGSVNYMAGAPMMYEQLVAELAPSARGRIKLAVSAGAPLKPELQDEYWERLSTPLVQGYGMTESLLLTLQPVSLREVKGTLGIPLPGVDVRLVDPDNPARELGPGETGELLARSPWIMKGYEFPEENEKAFIDGWLRTGDLIYMDENGLLYFRGVRKRLIKYKAYAILPRDLEVLLERHPAVAKAIVEGVPDEAVGQKPVARVWIRRDYQGRITPEELLSYINSRVAFYKKVRDIRIEGYL